MKLISLSTPAPTKEQTSLGKGWAVSLAMHILFLALLCLPFLVTRIPPPESEGLLVNLGLQDQGQGNETPKGQTKELSASPTPQKPQPEIKPSASHTPAKETVQKSITSKEDSGVTARETEAREKAAADAQRKAAEEAQQQAAYNNAKKSYGDLLGNSGKGNTGKAGSQGDPNGDPNSDILEGISKGSGRVGGGLGNRGVLHEPQINDRSQKTGRVVITVCVDKTGKVIKAEYTQKGSTTTDSELRDMARKAALQFKFTTSEIEEQCGTITVDFKVKG
jgi:TonB family protein